MKIEYHGNKPIQLFISWIGFLFWFDDADSSGISPTTK